MTGEGLGVGPMLSTRQRFWCDPPALPTRSGSGGGGLGAGPSLGASQGGVRGPRRGAQWSKAAAAGSSGPACSLAGAENPVLGRDLSREMPAKR